MSLNERDRELVAIGASIASNCVPCIEHHIAKAIELGLTPSELRQAIGMADKVRQVPAKKVLEAAWIAAELTPGEAAATPSESSCCG